MTQEEVERFAGAAGGDSIERLLHVHRYQIATKWAAHRRVLDIGSGEGFGARMMSDVAKSVLGIERDQASVERAQKKYAVPNLRFAPLETRDLGKLDAGAFDLITSFEVLEHVDAAEQERMIRECARLLAPGGALLLSTPNSELKERQYSRFPEWRNPYHVREVSREELEALLRRSFKQVQILPQAIEIASFVGGIAATSIRIPDSAAWVNIACASQELVEWPADIEAVTLPRGLELVEGLLLAQKRQASAAAGAPDNARVFKLHSEVDRMTAELLAARSETARTQHELVELRREHELLRMSLSHRVSTLFNRFPGAKRALIRLGHLVIGEPEPPSQLLPPRNRRP